MYQELLKVKGDSLCLTDKNITNISDGWALPPSYLDFAQELGFGRLMGLSLRGKIIPIVTVWRTKIATGKIFSSNIKVYLSSKKKKT